MEKTAKRIGIAVIAVLLVALLCVGIALALPQTETPLASSDSGSGAELATANVVKVEDGTTYDLDSYQGAMDYYNYLTGTLGYHGITSQDELENWARDGVEGNLATSLQGKAALKPYDETTQQKITYKFGGTRIMTSEEKKKHSFEGGGEDWNNYNVYLDAVMKNGQNLDGDEYNIVETPDIFRAAFDGCGADVLLYPPMPDETVDGTSSEMTNDQVNDALGQGSALSLMPNSNGQSMFTGAFGVAALGARLANFNFSFAQGNPQGNLCFIANQKNKGVYSGGLFGAMINCDVNNCSVEVPSGATLYGKKEVTDVGYINEAFGSTGNPSAREPGYGTLSFGAVAGYSYGTSFTNMQVSINGSIKVESFGAVGTMDTKGGVPRGFIGGLVGVSQGIDLHNIVVTGTGSLTADPQEPWYGGDTHGMYSRVGALVGMDFSGNNADDTQTLEWGAQTGASSVSGIITSYTGNLNYAKEDDQDGGWVTERGTLFGSIASQDVSGVYYLETKPDVIGGVNAITPYKITATSDKNSGVTIGFVNNAYPQEARTSDDTPFMDYILGEFSDLDVTYTVPDAVAGNIVWAYTVNDGAEQTLYDKQDKGHSSYTIEHKFTTAQDTVYKFTTGTRVTFDVLGKDDVPLSDEEYAGEGKNVVDSKQFDNNRFAVPKLKVVDMNGNAPISNNVLHFNNDVSTGTAVWSIWKGNNTNVDGATAAGAGDYTYRFRTNTTDDLFYFINVNGDERVIAYKSDNDPEVSRVYSYHIDPKEVEVSFTGSEFTYDTNPQKPNFTWKWVDGDASVPLLNISYKNAEGGALAEAQVTEAGSYTATVSQFASGANYTITNLEALQAVNFTIVPRKLTLEFTADDSRPYNGAPQFPEVTVGNLPAKVSADVAVNKYYFNGSDPGTASDDIVASTIINVGDYMLRVAPANNNYVIDTEKVTGTSGSVSETEAWKMFSITKAELKFDGTEDDNYTFVYGPEAYTLGELNSAIGGDKDYLFQPADSTNENPVDQNLGSGVDLKIVSGPSPDSIWYAGQYQVTVTYEETDNFLACTATLNVTVQQRELTLTLNNPETNTFEYGSKPVFEYDSTATGTGAVPEDEIIFGIVYYRDDGDGGIKPIPDLQGADPKAVGSYIASFEPISSSVLGDDILVNYYISESSDNTFAYEITPRTLTVTFDGDLSPIPYDGEEHRPATIGNVEGIIPEEQGDYNKDTLKVFYVNETGDSASSARNAGTYTLAVAPEANSKQFMTNYVIGDESMKTFTIEEVDLTVSVGEISADYATINNGLLALTEGAYIVEQGKVYDADIFDLVILGKVNGDQITETNAVDSVGNYVYTLKLKEDGNALNYNLVSVLGKDGAAQVTTSNGGTLIVEGTEVRLILSVKAPDGSVSSLSVDEDGNFVVGSDNAYAYAAGDYSVTSMFMRTMYEYEGVEFEVSGAENVNVSLDEQGMPKLVAKNAGNYQFTISLTETAATMYKFAGNGQSSITVTFVIEKRKVTVAPNDVTKTYGDDFADNGWYVEGDADGALKEMLEKDGFAPSITSTTDASTAANTTGKVTLTQAFAAGSESNANNYVFTTEEGSVTVVPRPVTVSVTTSGSAVYGDGAPEITAIEAAEGSKTIIDGDADDLIAGLNTDGVLDLANRNVGKTKIVIAEGKNAIGNYVVTLAEDTGTIDVTPKKISVDVADGVVPYGATEADIRPANGVYFNGESEFAYDDATKEFVFKISDGEFDLATQEPGTAQGVLQIKFVDETLNDNYEIEFTNGDLTVEAMTLEAGQVKVELEKDTYDGTVIRYDIFVGTVNVTDADPRRLIVTINGSADTEIKDAGEYVFEIKGDNTFYQGDVTVTVTVKQADIKDMGFGLDKESATYTGSVIVVTANPGFAVSYTVTQDGKEAQLINAGTYTVTVKPTDPNYTGSKEFKFTINKAPHKAPVESDLKIEVTWNSVTVTHDEFTVQLSKNGTDWDVDTTMGGYEANSSYTLHVRFKADDNHSEGGEIMISGKTAERTAVEFEITDVEEHYNRAVLTINFEEAFSGTVKFSIDGGKTWNDLTVQDGKYVASGLAESTEYTLQVKIPAGDDYLESEVKPVPVKTGIDPAKYTETLAMFGETFSAGDLVNYETLKEQFNGLTEADKAGVDADKFETITAARNAFVASVNSDIEDIQNVAAKTAGRAVAAAAAAVTAAAIALFIAKRKFI